MSKSYSQLLKDIETGEIISIILIPSRREVIVDLINGERKVIPIFYNVRYLFNKKYLRKTRFLSFFLYKLKFDNIFTIVYIYIFKLIDLIIK